MKVITKSITSYYYYYELHDSGQPVIEILKVTDDTYRSGVIGINEIIFVLQGKCELTCDIYPPTTIREKESIFVPTGSHFHATSQKDSEIIIFRLDPLQKLHGFYSVEDLYTEAQHHDFPEDAGKLEINEIMNTYLATLADYIKNGVNHYVLYEIKIKELLLILNAYYKKQHLCYFFRPVLNNDFIFASFVLKNWENAKNAKELAELAAYSEAAFNKKFKKVFGTTPYKWINEKRATQILYTITNTDKPLKQIADEYNFGSQQQFNDYCLRNFKQTPGNIRTQ
ncbi:MAG: helix-turn-helix domain-containing protein [Tannerellaceae bacterium]|nr:helix-turn-helix domain-containing protein [Tannerellaceae bacterium]